MPMPGQPGQPGQPMPGAKPETPAVVTRPAKPKTAADPAELTIKPDDEGKIRFNFQGQPWPDVLEWLAKASKLSLDWQELPGDHLNLRTQRSYTLEEARDLINRHLLDRGFTMLKNGEVLTVANLKKLDPSLVPRVAPDALEDCRPHEFVKVSFPLRSLLAETAVEELKPMLSPNGKISALKVTNRIEVLDAAANLIEIAHVLGQEQTGGAPKRLVREFKLQHRRAADVHEMINKLLGLDAPAQPGAQPGQDPQQAAMQQMMMLQQQQQGGQQPQLPKQAPKIHLVVDTRENSLLAHAPADQMAIIAEAITTVDVPSERSGGLLKNLNRMQVYRLNSIDPDTLVKVLNELGELDPATTLKSDKSNKSVVAYATLVDHLTIRQLVDKLDGTGRQFEVIRLRRLEADYVAGTIEAMMGGAEKKKQRRNPYAMFEFGPWGMGGQQQEEDTSRGFRVDADVEHNRLLIFANEVEMKEITNLLVKLGEIPNGNEPPRTYRILDVSPEEGDELLRRLKNAWPNVGPNPLIVPQPAVQDPEAQEPLPPRDTPKDAAAKPVRNDATPPVATVPTLGDLQTKARVIPVAQARPATPPEAEDADADEGEADVGTEIVPDVSEKLAPPVTPTDLEPPTPPAPIRISRGTDGRLVFQSKDTAALDALEDLTLELAPGRKDYKLFKLKYPSTWAYGVVLNLREFFEETTKDDRRDRQMSYYFGYGMPAAEKDTTRRLSKRRQLKFISDSDTNTVLVVGADAAQLKIVEELIDLYDQPPANETKSVRMTKLFTLRYAKARVVSDAIKDVYRDLLSVNDRAMQQQQNNNNNQNQRPAAERNYTFIYGGGDESEEQPEQPIKFKGLLSLGVDEASNTIIVSAAEGLLENVGEMIDSLEEAAKPRSAGLQVLTLTGKVDPASLRDKLQKLVGTPPQPGQQQPGQMQPGQQFNKQQPGQQQVEQQINFNAE